MEELPTGTITMLFSDIEGSTALLKRLSDRYGEALSAQRALVRAAISSHSGFEMGTEGDSFYVVFQSATDALRCCTEAQRALAGHDWPGGVAVRVRMGLHSGEPVRHEDAYIGIDVNRAARIAASAHGGQVVLSEATRLLVESHLPADVSVCNLGFHRLKDIDETEHLYQLVIAGLQEEFPPLKTLGAETSLPVPMTPLIGRDDDLERLRATIAGPGVRLVTLTGPGGVGKTRMALAAASSLGSAFPHGVFFVDLAAVGDGDVMWKTIARDLDADGEGEAAVTEHLRDRHALLVLDNLEQLHGAAEVVAALVSEAPRLVVLATSRGPLHVQGEHELPLPPLPTPGPSGLEEVEASAAVQLFVQQARLLRPSFRLDASNAVEVAAICRRLDGLPLAIELAASRVRLLTPKALLARLGDSLALGAVEVGRPSRHQTLRATIAWSYDLLTPPASAALRRMGVFAGGCDLDALASVAVADDASPDSADPLELVEELMDVSLVAVTEGVDGEPRFRLAEMIREFAVERLGEANELDAVQGAHARYFTEFAERTRPVPGPAQLEALDRLEAEHDNLRAALAWSLQADSGDQDWGGDRAVTGLRLVAALFPLWYQHGHVVEGRQWLQWAMGAASATGGAPLANVAHGLAVLLQQQGENDASRQLSELSLATSRELGDRDQEARALNTLGITYNKLGNHEAARSCLESSIAIAREMGSATRTAAALTNLGHVESAERNFDRAAVLLGEALILDQQQGDALGVALDQQSLAGISLRAGQPRASLDQLADMFAFTASSGNPGLLTTTLEMAAEAVAGLGAALRAARLSGAAAGIRAQLGMPLPGPDAEELEGFLRTARSSVAPEAWQAAVEAGQALGQDGAVNLLTSLAAERGTLP